MTGANWTQLRIQHLYRKRIILQSRNGWENGQEDDQEYLLDIFTPLNFVNANQIRWYKGFNRVLEFLRYFIFTTIFLTFFGVVNSLWQPADKATYSYTGCPKSSAPFEMAINSLKIEFNPAYSWEQYIRQMRHNL